MDQVLLANVRKLVSKQANICTCKIKEDTQLSKLGLVGEKYVNLRTAVENSYNLQPTLFEWKTVRDIYNFLKERI